MVTHAIERGGLRDFQDSSMEFPVLILTSDGYDITRKEHDNS